MVNNMKEESTKLDKKELIEKTIKFYFQLESWNEFGEFDQSLKEMAIQIIANEPKRVEQLFPGYKLSMDNSWSVKFPKSMDFDNSKIDYITEIMNEAKEMALKELMSTTKEANA